MIKVLAFWLAISFTFMSKESDESVPKELVGIWRLESTSFKGAVPTKPEGIVWLVILNNGEFVIKSKDHVQAGTVAVDISDAPVALDIHVQLQSGSQRKWTNLARYEIKENLLTISKAAEGKGRPSDLKPSVDYVVQVFRKSAE